jgi:hypothetical protein
MEKAAQSDEKINGDDADTKAKPMMNNSHRRWCFVGAAGALGILIVLALSLGLGLGLGLKARNGQGALVATPSGSMIATPTSTEAPSNTPAAPQPWRRDTLDYNLDLSWNISASPTTRIYNLTVSEIQAAPDGELPLSSTIYRESIDHHRCASNSTSHQWAISRSSHTGQSRRPHLGQCDKPVDKRNLDALAWPISKWYELDGWDYRNYSMSDSARGEFLV